MATQQGGEEGSEKSSDLAEVTHFFKVVLFPNSQGLKIPNAFMRKYAGNLQKIMFLKVPTGASWKVEVVSYDSGTWLRQGWQEFAAYYSIKKHHFLVFRYDGKSEFHVLIFDTTASEIEYRVDANSDSRQENQAGTHKVRHSKVWKSEAPDQVEELSRSIENFENHPSKQLSKRGTPETDCDDDDTEDDVSIGNLDKFMTKNMRQSRSYKTGNTSPKHLNLRRSRRLLKREKHHDLS